jgi:hypothetical protein
VRKLFALAASIAALVSLAVAGVASAGPPTTGHGAASGKRDRGGSALVPPVGVGGMVAHASPPAKTHGCSSLDGSLAAEKPGTEAFHRVAWQALRHGCAAYVSTADGTLGLEFIRGPLAGTSIVIGPEGVVMTDIALSSSGTLYGDSYGAFYTLNVDTGQATLVGPLGLAWLANALVVGPTGTVYGSGRSGPTPGVLVTIDPTTGAGTEVGSSTFASSGDIAFAHDGTLYMTSPGGTGDALVSVDPTTGAVTSIGPTGFSSVYGLLSSYGTLFGLTAAGQLLTIDPATGAGTAIAGGGPAVFGAASLPSTT